MRQCHEAGVELTSLPDLRPALRLSLFQACLPGRFCFEAFLPPDKKERQMILEELKRETRTILVYEAPHRLERTLAELFKTLGERNITVCRELTKRYEEAFRTTFSGALSFYDDIEPKGECVIVIEGKSFDQVERERQQSFEEMTIAEHMERYLSQGMDKKEAMKKVAKDRGISKRDVYQSLLEEDGE